MHRGVATAASLSRHIIRCIWSWNILTLL